MVEGQIMEVLGRRVMLVPDGVGNNCEKCCLRPYCKAAEMRYVPCVDLEVYQYHFEEVTKNQ